MFDKSRDLRCECLNLTLWCRPYAQNETFVAKDLSCAVCLENLAPQNKKMCVKSLFIDRSDLVMRISGKNELQKQSTHVSEDTLSAMLE